MKDYIDRQMAIDLVKDVCDAVMSKCEIWYNPEVEGEVYKDIREVNAILKCNKEMRIALRNMPSAQPEIIYCKDCVHNKSKANVGNAMCELYYGMTDQMGFCHRGERRDG